jgi:hypothetical protein
MVFRRPDGFESYSLDVERRNLLSASHIPAALGIDRNDSAAMSDHK